MKSDWVKKKLVRSKNGDRGNKFTFMDSCNTCVLFTFIYLRMRSHIRLVASCSRLTLGVPPPLPLPPVKLSYHYT